MKWMTLTLVFAAFFPGLLSAAEVAKSNAQQPLRPLGWLTPLTFTRPFAAQVHSPVVKIDIGATQVQNEYNISGDYSGDRNRNFKTFLNLDLGTQIPIYSGEISPAWGFGITLPASMHVFEDMFDSFTAPVINVDFRFGLPKLSAIYRLTDAGLFRNISVAWLPWFHESTHLGDEITIYRKNLNLPITRVNVSYEYTELFVTLNDPDGHRGNNHALRLGTMVRISNRGYGWYGVTNNFEANFTGDLGLRNSTERFEVYLNYEFQRASGWLASSRALNIISFEVRNRVRYGIPTFILKDGMTTVKEVPEERTWTFNAMIGYKFLSAHEFSGSLGVYLHGYYGINPYGMLRNISNYRFLGIAFVYEAW